MNSIYEKSGVSNQERIVSESIDKILNSGIEFDLQKKLVWLKVSSLPSINGVKPSRAVVFDVLDILHEGNLPRNTGTMLSAFLCFTHTTRENRKEYFVFEELFMSRLITTFESDPQTEVMINKMVKEIIDEIDLGII